MLRLPESGSPRKYAINGCLYKLTTAVYYAKSFTGTRQSTHFLLASRVRPSVVTTYLNGYRSVVINYIPPCTTSVYAVPQTLSLPARVGYARLSLVMVLLS